MMPTYNYVARRPRNSGPSAIAVKASHIIGSCFNLRNGGFGNRLWSWFCSCSGLDMPNRRYFMGADIDTQDQDGAAVQLDDFDAGPCPDLHDLYSRFV